MSTLLGLGQFQTQRQGLSLTPALTQSIRLLQLSTLELEQEIEHMLIQNPFLTREDDVGQMVDMRDEPQTHDQAVSDIDTSFDTSFDASSDTPEPVTEVNWEGDGTHELNIESSDWGAEDGARGRSAEWPQDIEDRAVHGDLVSHLKAQLLHMRLLAPEKAAAHYLIDNLNEQGFLEESLDVLAQGLTRGAAPDAQQQEELIDLLRIALSFIQSLDPCGVGAKDTLDSLRVQVRQRGALGVISAQDKTLALQLLAQPLQDLLPRHAKRLSKVLSVSEALVLQGLHLIASLNPAPAAHFALTNNAPVQPDVFVRQKWVKGGEGAIYTAELNTDAIPRLRLDEVLLGLVQLEKERRKKQTVTSSKDGYEQIQSMQACALEARGFIKSITQRFDTILRVASAITARQQGFFVHGVSAMRPLTLREVADELGLHESTVSRVTTAKFMMTPRGMLEFKYFFDAGLSTSQGNDTSGTAVRAKIAEWIAAENKARPLSDSQIADKLARQGVQCARRTVAKYREALRIPAVSLRRT